MSKNKKINQKKLIIVSIILIIIGIVSFFVVKHIKGNVAYVAPNMPIEEQDDGMVKYENKINGINIGNRKIEKVEGQHYIIIEIENTLNEDRFDIPIGIEFVNLDGDVIYNTGCVVDVLLKGMTDEIILLVTPEIAYMVNNKKIDHLIISEM